MSQPSQTSVAAGLQAAPHAAKESSQSSSLATYPEGCGQPVYFTAAFPAPSPSASANQNTLSTIPLQSLSYPSQTSTWWMLQAAPQVVSSQSPVDATGSVPAAWHDRSDEGSNRPSARNRASNWDICRAIAFT